MPFEAKVISIRTRRYTEEELNQLSLDKYNKAKHGFEERPIEEETLAHIVTDDLEELRRQVIEIAQKMEPNPIIVLTDAFPDCFLVGKQYHRKSPNPIFEQILFMRNPDHPAVIQQMALQDHHERHRDNAGKIHERAGSSLWGNEDGMLEYFKQKEAESLGMKSYDEFAQFLKDSMRNAQPSGLGEKEAIAKMQEDIMKKYYEHGGKGAFIGLENPKQTLKNTTIQFRVISKREDMASINCCRYYAKRHGIALSCATTNAIPDATVSFKYPKRIE